MVLQVLPLGFRGRSLLDEAAGFLSSSHLPRAVRASLPGPLAAASACGSAAAVWRLAQMLHSQLWEAKGESSLKAAGCSWNPRKPELGACLFLRLPTGGLREMKGKTHVGST